MDHVDPVDRTRDREGAVAVVGDHVVGTISGKNQDIVAGTARDLVVARAAEQYVVARTAGQRVVTGSTVEYHADTGGVAGIQRVLALTADDRSRRSCDTGPGEVAVDLYDIAAVPGLDRQLFDIRDAPPVSGRTVRINRKGAAAGRDRDRLRRRGTVQPDRIGPYAAIVEHGRASGRERGWPHGVNTGSA